jgi:hypothetical protein
MFWAPSLTSEPSIAPATPSSAVKGGQMTTSTSDCVPTATTISRASETASAEVLFIFQLPAMSFLRIMAWGPGVASGFEERDPGRTLPSRYSRLAPPPVEQCVTLSATLELPAAVAVSPPPTTVVAPWEVASAIASAIALVEAANFSNSKTPDGPFQTIVFALQDGRPVERDRLRPRVEAHPALRDPGRVVRRARRRVRVEPVRADVVDRQDDRDPARLGLLDQLADDLRPLRVEEAVADLHPVEDLLEGEGHAAADDDLVGLVDQVADEGILSAIFAPPRMARSGLRGLAITAANALSSASMRNPAAFSGRLTPTIEEWARWAVPKASFT